MNKSKSKTKVPRNFLLLDCLNKSINYANVTYGLADEDEYDERYQNNYSKMEYWNATIMFDDGDSVNVFDMYCRCTSNYPKERPIIQFSKQSLEYKRINKLCNNDGTLNENALNIIKWNESLSLGDYLTNILNQITNIYY